MIPGARINTVFTDRSPVLSDHVLRFGDEVPDGWSAICARCHLPFLREWEAFETSCVEDTSGSEPAWLRGWDEGGEA